MISQLQNTEQNTFKPECAQCIKNNFFIDGVSSKMYYLRTFLSAFGYLPYTIILYILIAVSVYIPTGTILRFYFFDETSANTTTSQLFWENSAYATAGCLPYLLFSWLYFWVR